MLRLFALLVSVSLVAAAAQPAITRAEIAILSLVGVERTLTTQFVHAAVSRGTWVQTMSSIDLFKQYMNPGLLLDDAVVDKIYNSSPFGFSTWNGAAWWFRAAVQGASHSAGTWKILQKAHGLSDEQMTILGQSLSFIFTIARSNVATLYGCVGCSDHELAALQWGSSGISAHPAVPEIPAADSCLFQAEGQYMLPEFAAFSKLVLDQDITFTHEVAARLLSPLEKGLLLKTNMDKFFSIMEQKDTKAAAAFLDISEQQVGALYQYLNMLVDVYNPVPANHMLPQLEAFLA
eukprot:GILK01002616.1.p1 GENE.GILK01002616.1~~GILK01002616.1.p1  ORF type:complete len:291 (+),score=43.37 GILK01002616.1:96-968(+)